MPPSLLLCSGALVAASDGVKDSSQGLVQNAEWKPQNRKPVGGRLAHKQEARACCGPGVP